VSKVPAEFVRAPPTLRALVVSWRVPVPEWARLVKALLPLSRVWVFGELRSAMGRLLAGC